MSTYENGLPAEAADPFADPPVITLTDEMRAMLEDVAAGVTTLNLRLGGIDGGLEHRVANIERTVLEVRALLEPMAEMLTVFDQFGQLAAAAMPGNLINGSTLVLPPPPFAT